MLCSKAKKTNNSILGSKNIFCVFFLIWLFNFVQLAQSQTTEQVTCTKNLTYIHLFEIQNMFCYLRPRGHIKCEMRNVKCLSLSSFCFTIRKVINWQFEFIFNIYLLFLMKKKFTYHPFQIKNSVLPRFSFKKYP